jgi:hypothetical protein
MNTLAYNATEFITTVISFTIQAPGCQSLPEKCIIRPSAYLMNNYLTNLMEKNCQIRGEAFGKKKNEC